MIKRFLIFNILLALLFQPVSQAFSAPILIHDHESISMNSDHTVEDCESGTSDHHSHNNDLKCEFNPPIGIPVSQIISHRTPASYYLPANTNYLSIPLDTLLKPPRNS